MLSNRGRLALTLWRTLYMLQDRAYAPIRHHRCLCKCPCRSFFMPGYLCRIWSLDSTGPYRFLRDGYIMEQLPEEYPECQWFGELVDHPTPGQDPYDWNYTVGMGRSNGLGTGIPFVASVSVFGQVNSTAHGSELWQASVDLSGNTQMDCRDAGGGVPFVEFPVPGWWSPAGYPGSEWFLQWLARRDDWVPPG